MCCWGVGCIRGPQANGNDVVKVHNEIRKLNSHRFCTLHVFVASDVILLKQPVLSRADQCTCSSMRVDVGCTWRLKTGSWHSTVHHQCMGCPKTWAMVLATYIQSSSIAQLGRRWLYQSAECEVMHRRARPTQELYSLFLSWTGISSNNSQWHGGQKPNSFGAECKGHGKDVQPLPTGPLWAVCSLAHLLDSCVSICWLWCCSSAIYSPTTHCVAW